MKEKLIKEIKESLEFAKSRGELNQEASWTFEQGVLLEYAEAEYILELLKTKECPFFPTMNTSSATICGVCGKEKFEHNL